MQTNVGTTDRIIRAIVGIAALIGALALGVGSLGGILMLVVGGVLVVTVLGRPIARVANTQHVTPVGHVSRGLRRGVLRPWSDGGSHRAGSTLMAQSIEKSGDTR